MLLAEGEQERRRLRSPVRGAASHLLIPMVSSGGSPKVQPPGLRLGRGLMCGEGGVAAGAALWGLALF